MVPFPDVGAGKGEPVRISSGASSGLTSAVVVPPLKVWDFTFTSISDAI